MNRLKPHLFLILLVVFMFLALMGIPYYVKYVNEIFGAILGMLIYYLGFKTLKDTFNF
jgi:multisubunit Na+/H+ antiporter MnhE subunit